MGFKGGTMLYYFFNLDRFSVDLDFDLLDESKTALVFDEIRKILEKYGTIIDEKDKFFNIFFLLNCQKGQQGIKIEISKRKIPFSRYEIKNFFGKSVIALNIEDAFAQKLAAATDRKRIASRDFYDIYFLFKNNFNFNEAIIKERTKKTAGQYLAFLKKFINRNLSQKNILHGIGEFVDEKQKDWIKKNLKKELISQIDFFLRNPENNNEEKLELTIDPANLPKRRRRFLI